VRVGTAFAGCGVCPSLTGHRSWRNSKHLSWRASNLNYWPGIGRWSASPTCGFRGAQVTTWMDKSAWCRSSAAGLLVVADHELWMVDGGEVPGPIRVLSISLAAWPKTSSRRVKNAGEKLEPALRGALVHRIMDLRRPGDTVPGFPGRPCGRPGLPEPGKGESAGGGRRR